MDGIVRKCVQFSSEMAINGFETFKRVEIDLLPSILSSKCAFSTPANPFHFRYFIFYCNLHKFDVNDTVNTDVQRYLTSNNYQRNIKCSTQHTTSTLNKILYEISLSHDPRGGIQQVNFIHHFAIQSCGSNEI